MLCLVRLSYIGLAKKSAPQNILTNITTKNFWAILYSVESDYEKKSTTVMEDSNTESISEDKKIKKNNSWIRQVIINLTLLYMIRLSLLPMLIVGMNVLHKKKSQWKKKILGHYLRNIQGLKANPNLIARYYSNGPFRLLSTCVWESNWLWWISIAFENWVGDIRITKRQSLCDILK